MRVSAAVGSSPGASENTDAMPSYVKYPDTCQFRNVVQQAERDRMTDGPLFFRGTAKADGTHADIVVKGGKTWLQSRNRVVTEADDNYNMAKWFSGEPGLIISCKC